jgi:hypothetical protein
MIPPADHRPSPWPIVLLIAAVLISMGPLLTCDFTNWDDDSTVHHNSRLNPPTIENVAYYWKHSAGALYIPVTYTVWAGLAAFARLSTPDAAGITLNPMLFHAANLVIHVIATLLVYSIALRLTRNPFAATIGALLFAVHPVQVEAVGWVSGLKDVLWGCFALAAIDQYLAVAQSNVTTPRRESRIELEETVASFDESQNPRLPSRRRTTSVARLRYALATFCFVLAMLSKPTAMVTPAIAIVLDYLLLQRSLKQIARAAVPWLLLTIPCMIWTRQIQPGAAQDGGPLWARPLIVLDSLNFYLGKLLWPATLTPDYGHRPAAVLATGHLTWTWIAPTLLAILAFLQIKKRPWLAAGGLVFIAGSLPMLGLIPFSFQFFSTTADHYLYVSMLGIAIVTAFAADRSRLFRIGLAILMVPLALRSFVQTHIWSGNETLIYHMTMKNPRSFAGYNLAGMLQLNAGFPEPAEELLRFSTAIEPRYPLAHNNLATLLVNAGRTDEALPHIRAYIRAAGNATPDLLALLDDPHAVLGIHYLHTNQKPQAAEQLHAALLRRPNDPTLLKLLKQSEK